MIKLIPEKPSTNQDDKKTFLRERYGVIKDIPQQKIDDTKQEVKEERKEYKEVNILDLLLRIEKMEGKFTFVEEFKDDVNERLAHLSEEIGELRSSFLEMDKNFSSLEAKTEKALDAILEIQPEKITREFGKKEAEILKIQTEIETIKNILDIVKRENEKVNKILEKIKNIENIVEMYKKVEEKIGVIDETKTYVDRLAGKSETIFAELDGKIKEIETQKQKLEKLDELTIDIVKMLDGISIKIPKFIEKENAEKTLRDIAKTEFENLKKDKDFIELVQKTLSDKFNQNLVTSLGELNNMISTLRNDLSSKLSIMSNLNDKIDVYFDFLETVNILTYTSDIEEIKRYLEKIRYLTSRMNELNMWNDNKKNFLTKVLWVLEATWESYGNHEIKEIFSNELRNFYSILA